MTDRDGSPEPTQGSAEPGFEELVADLEAVVEQLERGELSLEEALSAFERGNALGTKAAAILDRAEARIEQLVEARGGRSEEIPLPLDE